MKIKSLICLISFSLTCLISCKKKEVRQLIKSYEGNYSVNRINSSCCDSLMQIKYDTVITELEVKKSFKGIKIVGITGVENFEVNETDSSFFGKSKDKQTRASGKFLPNESIFLSVSYSSKLPNGARYFMIRK